MFLLPDKKIKRPKDTLGSRIVDFIVKDTVKRVKS